MALVETYFFHRAELDCLLARDEQTDAWFGYVGLKPEHKFYKSRICEANEYILYHYNLIGSTHLNNSREKLWWVGFSIEPYSRIKTLERLKECADILGNTADIEDLFDSDFFNLPW